jgi:hypothetical protein
MFKKNTVFILGAGASWHYGYPTGEDLVRGVKAKADEILQTYEQEDDTGSPAGNNPVRRPNHFRDKSFGEFPETVRSIRSRLIQANPLVIDDFLGRNKGIADIGKLLIAMVLFECEKKQDRSKGDWVRYIVQQLTVGCDQPEDLLANQVTFITFNYDLSLELRLHQALKSYQYFAEAGFSDRFYTKERFLHVYGQLYEFDSSHPGAPKGPYNNMIFPFADEIDRAYDSAQNIHTISHDEKSAAPEIVKAIAEAEYLYFLGYGFDHRNSNLLGLGQCSENIKRQYVYFTNKGNSNKVNKSVERAFGLSNPENRVDENPFGDLMGDHYRRISNPLGDGVKFYCEKSIKSVYDALAQDFDWPE